MLSRDLVGVFRKDWLEEEKIALKGMADAECWSIQRLPRFASVYAQ
jgi:hypothetical protein